MFHVEHTSFYDDISTIYCQSYYTNPKLIHQNKKHRVSRETRCLYYVYKSYQHMPVVFPDLIRDLLCIDCKNLKFHSTRSGAKAVECGSRVLEVERLGVVVVGGVHRLELGVVLQHVDLRFAAGPIRYRPCSWHRFRPCRSSGSAWSSPSTCRSGCRVCPRKCWRYRTGEHAAGHRLPLPKSRRHIP